MKTWLRTLKQFVKKNPIVILRFYDHNWDRLTNSYRGINEFTFARSHDNLDNVKPRTACLIIGRSSTSSGLYFGLISSKSPVSTLESRLKIRGSLQISPDSEHALLHLLQKTKHFENLKNELAMQQTTIVLSSKLSIYLIERLASFQINHRALRTVVDMLTCPTQYNSNESLQADAVQTALKAFGLASDDRAFSLMLVEGRESALKSIPIMEDSVIEHDARHIPGYKLIESDLTGHAVFKKGNEKLEVFTANRRPLERVFGVDLIYFNASRQNIVMLQYKMLEKKRLANTKTDWIYRPDAQLEKEIIRMKSFAANHKPNPYEYRLNPTVFYLKFVKRDSSTSGSNIIMPIDHFQRHKKDPSNAGPRGGLRVSYNSLSGRYLRQSPFLDLLRSGYIGGHAETTKQLHILVRAILNGNRSVVAAIQKQNQNSVVYEN